MKKFRERKPLYVALTAAVIFVVAAVIALDFENLPLVSSESTHSAYFNTAVGVAKGDVVTVAGVRVGKITGISLATINQTEPDGRTHPQGVVKITFKTSGVHLGSQTRVNTKVINPVGVEYLEVVPKGDGSQHGTIPLARTSTPGTLISDLNQLTTQTLQTNIPQLEKSLEAVSGTLGATDPAATTAAINGVANLSQILASRSGEISQVIKSTSDLVSTINGHSAALIDLLGQSNGVLSVLQQRQQAVTTLLSTTQTLTGQLDHLLGGNDGQVLHTLLDNLYTVSQDLGAEKGNIAAAIPQLAAFSKYAANALGSGPFGDFVTPAVVLPDNVLKQCASSSINPLLGCRS